MNLHLGQFDHKWTELNKSVHYLKDTFKTHALKPLAQVVWDAFDLISFVM